MYTSLFLNFLVLNQVLDFYASSIHIQPDKSLTGPWFGTSVLFWLPRQEICSTSIQFLNVCCLPETACELNITYR